MVNQTLQESHAALRGELEVHVNSKLAEINAIAAEKGEAIVQQSHATLRDEFEEQIRVKIAEVKAESVAKEAASRKEFELKLRNMEVRIFLAPTETLMEFLHSG